MKHTLCAKKINFTRTGADSRVLIQLCWREGPESGPLQLGKARGVEALLVVRPRAPVLLAQALELPRRRACGGTRFRGKIRFLTRAVLVLN